MARRYSFAVALILTIIAPQASQCHSARSRDGAPRDLGGLRVRGDGDAWTGPPAPQKNFSYSLDVTTASYAGSSKENNMVTAVAVDATGVVWIGGSGTFSYGLHASSLIPGERGFLVSFDVKSSSSHPEPKKLVTLGESVLQVFYRGSGSEARMLVSGDFGLAVLDGEASKVIWHNDLSSFPGSNCTAPLSESSVHTCRVALASDGHVAAVLRTTTGYQALLFDPTGKLLATDSLKSGGHFYNDVAIDPKEKLVILTYFYDTHLPTKLPVQVPCIFAVDYTLQNRKWQSYCWSGKQMTGNEADSRGELLYMNEDDGILYFAGIAYGGNTCFRYTGTDLNKTIDLVSYDKYTSAYNTRSNGITFVSRMNPKTGEVLLGQILLTRDSGSGKGNSVEPRALAVDAKGYIFLAQGAACCVDNRGNLTVDGQHLGSYSGGDGVILVLSPDFTQRLHWTGFAKEGSSSTAAGQAVATGGGQLAFAAYSKDGQFIEANAIPETGAKANAPNSFVAVWPAEAG